MTYFVLEGRARKVSIPRNCLLTLSKLQNNLKPLHYTGSEVNKEERVNAQLTTATFGSVRV